MLGATPSRIDHGAVEPALGLEDARSIDEDQLAAAGHRDAAHGHARRLNFVRNDRHFGAHQRVDKRRFASVGTTQNRDETAARGAQRLGRGVHAV